MEHASPPEACSPSITAVKLKSKLEPVGVENHLQGKDDEQD